MKTFFIFGTMFILLGCQSEIDKCVEAGLKADEPYKSAQDKSATEVGYRIGCLKASAGK
jgi:hypothetical protein